MSTQKKVVIQHVFNAPVEMVFKAWTTPSLMAQWYDGSCEDSEKVVVHDVKVDLKVGGKFEVTMGESKYHHHGIYKEIFANEKLVFTWNSPFVTDTLVTLDFKAKGKQTEFTLTHELLTPDMVAGHTHGWSNIVKHLIFLFKK